MRLGYLLPTREHVMTGEHGTRELLDLARTAADCGFKSLWVGDSLVARPRHDPITLLAGVAIAVPQLALGTAVLLPALRNPVVLAQQLATVDQLSEGRLIVGAGIGADAPTVRAEFAAASVPFEKRVGRLVEGFNLCRALWQGEPVTWDGRWTLQEATLAPRPYREGGPPIWLASSVEPGVQRIARLFDGWFPIGPNACEVARLHDVLEAEAKAQERPTPTTAVYLTICIDEDRARADEQINTYLESYYQLPATLMRSVQACCGGPLEEVQAFLNGFIEAGASELVLRIVGEHRAALNKLTPLN